MITDNNVKKTYSKIMPVSAETWTAMVAHAWLEMSQN